MRCENHLNIQTWSPHPPLLPPSQPLHRQAPGVCTPGRRCVGGVAGKGLPWYHVSPAWSPLLPLQSSPRAHMLGQGHLSLAETQASLKSHLSLPSLGPASLPASGRAPSGSVPTSCAASGQMLPLLEAEEASLHLATPAAAAALPQRDTCRGHQAFFIFLLKAIW